MTLRRGATAWFAAAMAAALQACTPAPVPVDAGAAFGLPPLTLPTGVLRDGPRIELGRKLFFDRRLSFNGTQSCAMCHVPEEGFTSHASKTAVGIEGKSLRRNAPTLLNVAWQGLLFHDGREFSLATQAWMPLLHVDEMANPSIGYVLQRIRSLPDYDGLFEHAFAGAGPGMDTLGAALAAFQSTLVAADSRFDRWRYRGDAGALSEQEQVGFRIFAGKGRCTGCHDVGEKSALFADGKFHVTGAGQAMTTDSAIVVPLAPGVQTILSSADLAAFAEAVPPDLGRFEITLDPADRFAFKTPSLRNVARTAPYMHDGSLPTLEAVVNFYDRGGGDVADKDARIAPLGLSPAEKMALVAFLRSLDGASADALAAHSRPSESGAR
ncbi:MAG: cytochrome c peroxidase [Burkholderiales bacterium]